MLNSVYILICIAAALTAFWSMQCLTVHAGFACRRKMAFATLRGALALLAGSFVLDAYAVSRDWAYASPWGTVMASAILLFLIALPFAMGGRRGAEKFSAI